MPLDKGSSKKAFKHNIEAEMSAGKPQKQALAIAYAVKRRNKMAKGGVAYRCPDCLAAGGQCYAHGGTVETPEPQLGNRAAEAHLDNEAQSHGQAYPPEHKDFDMYHMERMQEPSAPFQKSGSPTMDMSVRGEPSHEVSLAEAIMRKRKDRGSDTARYAQGGPVLEADAPNPQHPSVDQDNARGRVEEEPMDPMNPYAPQGRMNPESHGSEGDTLNPNSSQEIESQKPKRYTMDGKRMLASGGYLDPNEEQSIHDAPPPVAGSRPAKKLPEGKDRSEMLDKVMGGPGVKQRYSDSSEDGIQSMHDYSILPESQIPQVLDPEHDSDMPDIAQQNSLIGQIMKKRRQLKRS